MSTRRLLPAPAIKEDVLLASAARTSTVTTATQTNDAGHRGLQVVINVSAITASPSLTVKIQGVSASGIVYSLLDSAAITATGTTVLTVDPDMTAAANSVAKAALPARWNVSVVHADADSATYTIDYVLLP